MDLGGLWGYVGCSGDMAFGDARGGSGRRGVLVGDLTRGAWSVGERKALRGGRVGGGKVPAPARAPLCWRLREPAEFGEQRAAYFGDCRCGQRLRRAIGV